MSNKKNLHIYFGKIMREFFAVWTPKYYKVSISNPKTILEEIQNYIYSTEGTSYLLFDHIKFLIEEYLYRSEKDIIFKEYNENFINFNDFLKNTLKTNISSKDFIVFIDELKHRIAPIIRNLQQNYFNKTTVSLLSLLDKQDEQINPWDFTKLKKICYAFSTEILRKGYSKYYIYQNIQKYLIYWTSTDNEKSFINLFNNEIKKYDIYVKIITKNKDIQEIFSNTFWEDNIFEEFSTQINWYWIRKNIEKNNLDLFYQENSWDFQCFWLTAQEKSIDYINASKKLTSKIHLVLDELKYEYQSENISLFHHALVKDENNEYNFPLISDSMYIYKKRSSVEYFNSKNNIIKHIYDSDSINNDTKRKVKTIFKFYRYFLESDTIEHKFLNLWIWWEHIFSLNFEKESQTWTNIHRYYPLIDSLSYIEDILRDMLQVQMNRWKNIKELEKLLSNDTKYCVTNLYKIIKDKSEKWEELLNLDFIKNNDLLKVKLFRLHEQFKSPKKMLSKNHDKVKWNLYRLYRVRNAIVHKWNIDSLWLPIEMLVIDLENYYINLLEIILLRLGNTDRFESIEQLFLSIDNTYKAFQNTEWISKVNETNYIKKKIINLPLIF